MIKALNAQESSPNANPLRAPALPPDDPVIKAAQLIPGVTAAKVGALLQSRTSLQAIGTAQETVLAPIIGSSNAAKVRGFFVAPLQ